jgi:methionine sulfoxide reductase heme-binding subunit
MRRSLGNRGRTGQWWVDVIPLAPDEAIASEQMMQTEKIVGTTTAGALLLVALAFALYGVGEQGWQMATRWTARYALLPFVVVFAAGELARHVRGPMQQILRSRRGLGLSFAVAHFIHAGAIVGLYVTLSETPSIVTLVGGGLAYLFILAMAVTSTDTARRAMGAWWQHLHRWGLRYVWLIFFQSYVGRIVEGGDVLATGLFGTTLLLAAAALRISGPLRRRTAT